MRDIALFVAIALGLVVTLRYPFTGVILWLWISVQNPHQETWAFAQTTRLNLIIAIVTGFAWLISRERKWPPGQFLIVAMLVFLAWTTFNGFFAYSPEWSWPYWDRTWKVFALGLVIAAMATNPVRIHATVWAVVLSLFYFGVKGGIFTLVTGGNSHVLGPADTIIGDNNQLAVALLMAIPLANYLRLQSANRVVSVGLIGGMALTLIAIVGSYSRGAFIALGALALAALLRSRRRITYLLFAGAGAAAMASVMPQSYWDRIATIWSAGEDASFEGRVLAWKVAYFYARDHFPFGAGFYGPQLPGVFNQYFPGQEWHAAHSIFFQVLGENGFVGLILYLAILVGAFVRCSRIIAASRSRPELEWCTNLARMIQLSLFVFCVGGAALSMAYYDVFVVCVSLLVPLGEIAGVTSRTRTGRVVAQTTTGVEVGIP